VSSDNPMNQVVVGWNPGRLKMGSIKVGASNRPGALSPIKSPKTDPTEKHIKT
jgi:hypothetical protein